MDAASPSARVLSCVWDISQPLGGSWEGESRRRVVRRREKLSRRVALCVASCALWIASRQTSDARTDQADSTVVSATPAKMTNHARGGLRVLCLCTVCVCVSSVLMIVCVLLFSSRRRLGRRLGVLFCVVSSDVHRISDLSRGVCVSLFRCRYRTAMLGVCQWPSFLFFFFFPFLDLV